MKKRTEFFPSHYQNCIGFSEIDFSDGCEVGCIYCGLTKSKNNIDKLDFPDLSDISSITKGIYLSPNTDPFSSSNKSKSKELLNQFLPKGIPFLIITKSKISADIIDLLADHKDNIVIQVSLARLNDELNNYVEPNASSAKARLETINKLALKGIKTTALLMPLYPSVDDSEILLQEIVKRFANVGAFFLKAAYVLIRDGSKAKDIQAKNSILNHPMLNKSWNLMSEKIYPHIGEANIYPYSERKKTYQLLTGLCSENNLKFAACSVLDPQILIDKQRKYLVCHNVWMFRKSRRIKMEYEINI